MDYIELSITTSNPSFVEILEAELSELPFDSFLVDKNSLKAYMPSTAFKLDSVKTILASYSDAIVELSTHLIPHQNWNAAWESNYEPVRVGNSIFIRAPFHEPPAVEHVITIEPNMSFGTGHHPTTKMVMEQMLKIEMRNKSFLDFGCGSAILCVLAFQLGAHGTGVEIDPMAAEAAKKNLKINGVKGFEIKAGGLEVVLNNRFHVIAANINRNVIQESASSLKNMLEDDGRLICSGFLTNDSRLVCASLESQGLVITEEKSSNEWVMLCASK